MELDGDGGLGGWHRGQRRAAIKHDAGRRRAARVGLGGGDEHGERRAEQGGDECFGRGDHGGLKL